MAHAVSPMGAQRLVARRPAVPKAPARGGVAPPCHATGGNGGSHHHTTVHKLIEQEGALMLPGVWDALSAKALQKAGHRAAFISGYGVRGRGPQIAIAGDGDKRGTPRWPMSAASVVPPTPAPPRACAGAV